MEFELDARLATDCRRVGRFPLSLLLMMNDARYPWFVLVPERAGVSEIYQLAAPDQLQLTAESSLLAKRLAELFEADKMNIANLGNVVSQLHIHHIVRYRDDAAWPGPVWGRFPAQPFEPAALEARLAQVRRVLADVLAA